MNKVRLGLIGMGNIGKFHADYLLAGKVARTELAAVCSTSPHKLDAFKAKSVAVFDDARKLIQSGTEANMPALVAATRARVMMPMHLVASFMPWLKPM